MHCPTRPSRSVLRSAGLITLVATITAALASATSFAQSPARPDHGLDRLPPVSEVTITALPRSTDGLNARLVVQYEGGKLLPKTIPLDVDGRIHTLERDAQDVRRYAGKLPFDFSAFVAEQARRKELAATNIIEPVFRGRKVIDRRPLAFLDPDRLIGQIENGKPITIPGEVVSGTAAMMSAASSLMVVDPLVVEDPDRTFDACTGSGTGDGAWTFNTLMTNMANEPLTGVDPSAFVEDWIKSWHIPHTINSFGVPPRPQIVSLLLDHWPRDGGGRLILKESPMRLLAIVNRVDLRDNAFYGGGGGGEGRFVFGVMARDALGNCSPTRFTIILEYGVPIRGCSAVKDYGQQWVDLDALPLGSPAYNAALQDITDQFTKADAAPFKPNGSAINQIRSNEFASGLDWELREFKLPDSGGLLNIVSTEMTPNREDHHPFSPFFAGSSLVAQFINANTLDIIANNYGIPELFLGQPFLTGASWNPSTSSAMVWNHPGIAPGPDGEEARRIFSLNTCDACHGGETETHSFLHIEPRNMGFEANLSLFLIGDPPGSVSNPTLFNMNDPVTGAPVTYGDLLHRQQDLDELTSTACLSGGLFSGLLSPHAAARTH